MKRKLTALIVSVLLLIPFVPITAHAATITVSDGESIDISVSCSDGDIVEVADGAEVLISGSQNVQIQCGEGVTVTLSGVTIDVSGTSDACALSFTGSGNTLELSDTSSLKSGDNEPGIRVESGTELEILGDGSVEVTGGEYGAGIGGGNSSDGGTITISGGTVTATGGNDGGAGIGGGDSGAAGAIIITGGIVTANNKYSMYNLSPAIGGKSGTITISGGTVNATSNTHGAAIGSQAMISKPSYNFNSITISGGTVNAITTQSGAAIGGADATKVGTITISGGTIYAESQASGAGIGAGLYGDVDTINITGGTITAIGSDYAAGIGSCTHSSSFNDYYSEVGAINISGGNINATGGLYSAGIGGSYSSWSKLETINITEGTVTATGGDGAAGIGSGSKNSSIESINITEGTVTATGGDGAAGIGCGSNQSTVDSITIAGGTVTATGGDNAAGIGSGYNQSSIDSINITGGTVTAISGIYAAGIGGTSDSNMSGTIFISGGLVFAESGYADDIGCLDSGSIVKLYGDAKVFLLNNTVQNLFTSSHYNFDYKDAVSGMVYSEIIPSSWSGAYSYLPYVNIIYNNNGGYGSKTEIVPSGYSVAVSDSADFYNEGYAFSSWNTSAGGTGTTYNPGDSVTLSSDLTLYAIWDTISVTSVTLSSNSESLYIDEFASLTATVSPSNAENPAVTWTSSDTSVATVSAAGVVKAVAEGTATIKASADGVSDSCTITVSYKSVSSVTLSDTSLSMYLGDTEALSATVLPTDAANSTVTWTSSDTSVATVTNGVVNAVGEGACTITATADGVYDTCSIYVGRVAVTSVELSYSSLSMYVDDQRILTADVSPSDATNPDVTWESSNESVATVNSNGVVTAVSVGTATITATADGVSDSCAVTVNDEPDVEVSDVDFIVENSSVTVMYVGDTLQLTVAVTPSDATDTSVTWASSDTSVITVSSSGKVTAVAVGDATITVTAQGNASATYKVTVKTLDGDTENDDSDGSSAEPTATPEVVIQSEETDVYLTFDLDVSNLGENAKYIQLPNEEIIDIEGKDVISVSILASDLNEGTLEIVTLDEDMVPLGSVELSASGTDEDEGFPWFIVLITAILSAGGMFVAGRLWTAVKK